MVRSTDGVSEAVESAGAACLADPVGGGAGLHAEFVLDGFGGCLSGEGGDAVDELDGVEPCFA